MDNELINKRYKIINITKELIPSIIKIADKELGNNFILPSHISENQHISMCASTIKKNKIIGFLLNQILTYSEFLSIYSNIAEKYDCFRNIKKIGIIKTIAVDSKWQQKGIGTNLINTLLNKIYLKCDDQIYSNIDLIFMMGWKQKNGIINISGIKNKFNFIEIGQINNFYYNNSLKYNYSCPVCGNPPCYCSVVLYIKKI